MRFDLEKTTNSETYKLLVGLVVPRPIALITSMDEQGQLNAAPFSAFNYFCTDPPIVGIGVTNRPERKFVPKDTARNIRRTGEFVVNVVTEDIADRMNICATDFPRGDQRGGDRRLHHHPSQKVKLPRLAEAHAALECREYTTMEIGRSRIILGRVVAIYVEDRITSMPTGRTSKPTSCTPSAA